MNFSRRGFLRIGMALGAAKALPMRALVPQSSEEPLFREAASTSCGIEWVHENAMSDNRYLPETLGPGCAFLDFDNDGWMDIYLVNSGPCDFWTPAKPVRNALYKNNRDGTFTDVTEKAGVAGGTFGMGVAVGDYDNDGWPDIFVTSYGRCILYKNNRNGTFSDVTEKAGLATPGWTTSAVWFDFDNAVFLIYLSAVSLTMARSRSLPAAITRSEPTIIASLEFFAGPPAFSTTTMAMARFLK